MTAELPSIAVVVLAHNEERRIAACIESLPLDAPGITTSVVVNGSTDRTAEIARRAGGRRPNVRVLVYSEGGKARSWNRYLYQDAEPLADVHVFVDGDAVIAPGSVQALARALAEHPHANAASGFPLNGRRRADYVRELQSDRGLVGDLYALRGSFLRRMKELGLRLPLDLVGDDSLIGALAKTDLGSEGQWDDDRIIPCPEAAFSCEVASLLRPRTLLNQYRRMINYSLRYFQNRMVSSIMRSAGPEGLPERLSELYPEWLPRLEPRGPAYWWFDRAALARIRRLAA
jgi:glycosyltransferase involved in cell wall biosynthesis